MVWNLRLHGDPGGPTPITGTARIVPTIFYIIIITSLQDTRGWLKLGCGALNRCDALGHPQARLGQAHRLAGVKLARPAWAADD